MWTSNSNMLQVLVSIQGIQSLFTTCTCMFFFKFSTVFNIQMQCICVDPIIGLIAYTCT